MSSINLILQLPPELLLTIVCQLPIEDVFRCKRICKYMYNLLDNSVAVQYLTELHAAYQRPLSSLTSAGTADCLEQLIELNSNWANLRFKRIGRLNYPLESSAVYELTGGKLVFGSGVSQMGDMNGTTALSVYDLSLRASSSLKDFEEWVPEVRHIKMPYPIADFAMDVSQNLLVVAVRTNVLSTDLHILSLDGVVQHPESSASALSVPIYAMVTMHISGPILATLYIDPVIGTDIVVVWNWQTGEMIGQVRARRMRSIVLLSSVAMVVANLDQESLDIYDINAEAMTVTLLRRLLLPRVSSEDDEEHFTYEEALLRAYPGPRYPKSPNNVYGRDLHSTDYPFTSDESDGIVACVFHTAPATDYTLFVHKSALFYPYESASDYQTNLPSGAPPLIPWSKWGPDNTRWLDIECSMHWICYVHGHRIAILEKRGDMWQGSVSKDEDPLYYRQTELKEELLKNVGDINQQLQLSHFSHFSHDEQLLLMLDLDSRFFSLRVLDFNPRAVKLAKSAGRIPSISPTATIRERAGRGQLLVTEPSSMNDIVKTRLPYLETTIRLHELESLDPLRRVQGAMINGECVILLLSERGPENAGVYVYHL